MKNKKIIILGGGGHASVLVDVLKSQELEVFAFVSQHTPTLEALKNLSHLTNDEDVLQYSPDDVLLVNGIGSIPGNNIRFKVYEYFKSKGYSFKTVIAPETYVSDYAQLAEGVQVLTGAIIQTGAFIAENTIVNTGSIIEHDCKIGPHNHVATGACLSGQVYTGPYVHIGTGASVIQSIKIGDHAVVGAGAVVNKDIANNVTVYPARVFIK